MCHWEQKQRPVEVLKALTGRRRPSAVGQGKGLRLPVGNCAYNRLEERRSDLKREGNEADLREGEAERFLYDWINSRDQDWSVSFRRWEMLMARRTGKTVPCSHAFSGGSDALMRGNFLGCSFSAVVAL
jgi:hypothetical protein